MDELHAQSVETLRRRFRYFLADSGPAKEPRRQLVSRIRSRSWNACVFGGTLRDIAVRGPYTRTRDIDIVVENVSLDEIEATMAGWQCKRNSFGGLRVRVGDEQFDLWPLHETWAWKSLGIGVRDSLYASFELLPKTTFLTVESVAVSLSPERTGGRRIYEHGFFESLGRRVIELNRPENPYPALCIARSLATAMRLGFAVGPRLAKYLVRTFESVTEQQIVQAQRRHYGKVLFGEFELSRIRRQLEIEHREQPGEPIELALGQQLELEFYAPEPVERYLLDNLGDEVSSE